MDQPSLASLLHALPVAALVTDGNDNIILFNDAAAELLGKIIPGTNFSSFISAEPLPAYIHTSTSVRLALDKGAAPVRLRSADGGSFIASLKRSHNGHHFIFFRDVTAQVDYIGIVKEQQKTEYELSRLSHIRTGNIDDALHEIVRLSAKTMNVSRINIWEFDENFTSIRSIINYDTSRGIVENITLYRYELPEYFNRMEREEIIPTSDALNDPKTREILENYILPFGIRSLMDVPVRIEGRMIGVVCFEDTEKQREWNVAEQNFASRIAQTVAQTLETHRRQEAQRKLEQALSEKKLLLAEINHRVKNNFSLIGDLLRMQEAKAQDDYHKKLFEEIRSRLLSMAMIHRQLYLADNISAVNFRDFLLDLTSYFRTTYKSEGVEISTLLDNCRLPIGKAVLCGLVVNELLTESCSDAFGTSKPRTVTLKLQSMNENVTISVSPGRTPQLRDEDKTGAGVVNELVRMLEARLDRNESGMPVTLTFSSN